MIIIQVSSQELRAIVKEAVAEAIDAKHTDETSKPEELLDLAGAAAFLKVSKNTIYAKTSSRSIPFSKANGRLYFERSKLLAWIQANEQPTEAEQRTKAVSRLRAARRRK